MHIIAFGQSDVGRQRNHNEDAYLVDSVLGLYIVCDGLGGHAAGEVASHMTIQVVQDILHQHISIIETYVKSPSFARRTEVMQLVERAVQDASTQVYELAQRDPTTQGMGTTIALLLALGEAVVIAHVGDSRVYLIRDGQAHRVTEDHSLLGELLKRGTISKADAAGFAYASVITRCLGQHVTVQVDTLFVECMAGDRFLLCSDGFHNALESDEELAQLSSFFTPDALPERCIAMANERGGSDNITVVLAQVEDVYTASIDAGISGHRKVELLKRIRLFHPCDYQELVKLISITHVRSYLPGEVILAEDTLGEEFYILLSGTVEVLKQNRVLLTLSAGAHFGEMGLVEKMTRAATIKALEPTRVILMQRDDFYHLLESEPQLAVKMLKSFIAVLNQRLRVTSTELTEARKTIDVLTQDLQRSSAVPEDIS